MILTLNEFCPEKQATVAAVSLSTDMCIPCVKGHNFLWNEMRFTHSHTYIHMYIYKYKYIYNVLCVMSSDDDRQRRNQCFSLQSTTSTTLGNESRSLDVCCTFRNLTVCCEDQFSWVAGGEDIAIRTSVVVWWPICCYGLALTQVFMELLLGFLILHQIGHQRPTHCQSYN